MKHKSQQILTTVKLSPSNVKSSNNDYVLGYENRHIFHFCLSLFLLCNDLFLPTVKTILSCVIRTFPFLTQPADRLSSSLSVQDICGELPQLVSREAMGDQTQLSRPRLPALRSSSAGPADAAEGG